MTKKKSEKVAEPQAAVDALEATAAETMHGDLVNAVLDELRHAQDVWQKLGEVEQQEVIDRVRNRTRSLIEQCVQLIAIQGFTRLRAKLDAITVKDGLKAVLTLSQYSESRHELIDAQGTTVFIVLADADVFIGSTDGIKADPDQGALVLNEVEKIGRKTKKPDADNDDGQEAA